MVGVSLTSQKSSKQGVTVGKSDFKSVIFTARLHEFFKNLFVFLYFSPSLSNFVVALPKIEMGFPSVINT